jgi:hypothetical protein
MISGVLLASSSRALHPGDCDHRCSAAAAPKWQAVLEATAFWRAPLRPMMSSRQLTDFYILDSEVMAPTGERGAGGAAPTGVGQDG